MIVQREVYRQPVVKDGYRASQTTNQGSGFRLFIPLGDERALSLDFFAVSDPEAIINAIYDLDAETGIGIAASQIRFCNEYGLLLPHNQSHFRRDDTSGSNYRVEGRTESAAMYKRDFENCKQGIEDELHGVSYGGRLTDHNEIECLRSADGKLSLRLHSRNLYGALLAYMYDVKSSGGAFRKCERCSRWLSVTSGRQNRTRFCSGKCRTAGHRAGQ
jgi:hypothetical protein